MKYGIAVLIVLVVVGVAVHADLQQRERRMMARRVREVRESTHDFGTPLGEIA